MHVIYATNRKIWNVPLDLVVISQKSKVEAVVGQQALVQQKQDNGCPWIVRKVYGKCSELSFARVS